MKKLVLLLAVVFSVGMISCDTTANQGSQNDSAATDSAATEIVEKVDSAVTEAGDSVKAAAGEAVEKVEGAVKAEADSLKK